MLCMNISSVLSRGKVGLVLLLRNVLFEEFIEGNWFILLIFFFFRYICGEIGRDDGKEYFIFSEIYF